MKRLIFCLTVMVAAVTFCNGESRNALLIANDKYTNFSSLANPVSEARSFSEALKEIGFDVTIVENATKEDMQIALMNFKKKVAATGGIALLHYGGHAVQVGDGNYLIPVDADIPDEEYVSLRTVDLSEIMLSMKGDSNIVILDACRNNPLPAGSGRSATRGLQPVGNKPKKSIIIYSAEPGNVAQDGVFTPILTDKITEQRSFNEIFNDVSQAVYDKTHGTQTPGCYVQLFPTTYLAGRPVAQQEAVIAQSEKVTHTQETPKKQSGDKHSQSNPPKTVQSDIDPEKMLDIIIGQAKQNREQRKTSVKIVSSKEMQEKTSVVAKTKHRVSFDAKKNLIIDERKFQFTGETNILKKNTEVKGTGSDGVFIKKRNVTLSPFDMGKYEVTQELFEFVMDDNPSQCRADNQSMYKMPSSNKEEFRPVENINRYHAISFCNKLSLIMGYKPCYYVYGIEDWEDLEFDKIPLVDDEIWDAVYCDWNANGYRMPTEAEWEFAAVGGERGISDDNSFAGGDSLDKLAWWSDTTRNKAKFAGTRMVGKKSANKLGLFDMSGNVAEWCWDLYGTIVKETVTNPVGAETGDRGYVVKGGGWESYEDDCRIKNRSRSYRSQYRANTLGLRLVRRVK